MDEAERAFSEALRRGAAAMPPTAQFDPERLAGEAGAARGVRGARGWWATGVAAAVLLAGVGIGVWVLRPLGPLPAAPAGPVPSSTGSASPETTPSAGDLPYLSYQSTAEFGAGDGGLLQGDLIRLEGGCLVVVNSLDYRDLTIPVFPAADTSWDAATGSLTIGGGTFEASGSEVGFGGGFAEQPPAGATVPAACASLKGRFFVVSSLDQNVYPTTSGPDLFVTTRGLPHAPTAVRDGRGRTSCGEIVLGQGERVPDSARECLAAAQGKDVELAFTVPTTEGDPMVYFVIGKPGKTDLELFQTSYWDRFGGSGGRDAWWQAVCPTSAIADADAFWQCTVLADWQLLPN